MDDLISREAVLENAFKIYTHECGLLEVVGAATIEMLPSVKPQTGHWIEKMDACECPHCHKAWDYCDNDTEEFDYCPKCGARLESEDKE